MTPFPRMPVSSTVTFYSKLNKLLQTQVDSSRNLVAKDEGHSQPVHRTERRFTTNTQSAAPEERPSGPR